MKHVAVVIVTFNNCAMLCGLLRRLQQQTRRPDAVYVIDNASCDATEAMVPREIPGVHYTRIVENSGSSGGYYEGIRRACADYDYIWTLDDDVAPAETALEKLIEGLEELEKIHDNVGAVRSLVSPSQTFTTPVELEIAPWRGTLFKKTALDIIGLPRNDYFIYGEDLEYSLRLRKHGFIIFWIPASMCCEIREGKTNNKFLGKQVKIYPSAFRLYYAFRNEVSICIEYRDVRRLAKTLFYGIKVIAYLYITEPVKGSAKRAAIIEGLQHAIRNRLGKNPKFTP